MEMTDFIQNFSDQFVDTDVAAFNAKTNFRELDEWSSLLALSVIAMIDEEYDVLLKADDMRKTHTIEDLFNLVDSKL